MRIGNSDLFPVGNATYRGRRLRRLSSICRGGNERGDCTECANCCVELKLLLQHKDIERLASLRGILRTDFYEKHIVRVKMTRDFISTPWYVHSWKVISVSCLILSQMIVGLSSLAEERSGFPHDDDLFKSFDLPCRL